MFVRVEHAAAAAASLAGPLMESDQLRVGGRVEGELVAWPTGAPQKQSHRPRRMLIGRVRGCARSRCTARRPVVQCIEV